MKKKFGFQRVIVVEKNNAQSLLNAIGKANELNADLAAERLFILIPNGFYDLGETVLTRISGHNVALIGESMTGVIIQNKPDVKIESISKTAVFQNRGTNNYYQDLTLKNALDYYSAEPDGRAVTLQDKGTRTICNHVRMLSYQDTYYSDNEKCQNYMQDTEIHGTIDFICGAGDVWFEHCMIVTEKRTLNGGGVDIITATRTSETKWGYIFNRCTIQNHISAFTGNFFKEYGTKDAQGNNITPKTNVVTFTLRDHTQPFVAETVMTKKETKQYTLKQIFGDWRPDKVLKKLEKQSRKLWKKERQSSAQRN